MEIDSIAEIQSLAEINSLAEIDSLREIISLAEIESLPKTKSLTKTLCYFILPWLWRKLSFHKIISRSLPLSPADFSL